MMTLNITEGVAKKLDLILAKLISLDSKMEELNLTVNRIQEKGAHLKQKLLWFKTNRKLDRKFSHIIF